MREEMSASEFDYLCRFLAKGAKIGVAICMVLWIRSCVRDVDERYYALLEKAVAVKAEVCGGSSFESDGRTGTVDEIAVRENADAKNYERDVTDVDDGDAAREDANVVSRTRTNRLRKMSEEHDERVECLRGNLNKRNHNK